MKVCELMVKALAEPQKYKGRKFQVNSLACIDCNGRMIDKFTIDENGEFITYENNWVYINSHTEAKEIRRQSIDLNTVKKLYTEGKKIVCEFPDYNDPDEIIKMNFWRGNRGEPKYDCTITATLTPYVLETGTFYVEEE